jgi:hypothetical protein
VTKKSFVSSALRGTKTGPPSATSLELSKSAAKGSTPTIQRPPHPYLIPYVWNRFVPEYKSINYGQQIIKFEWNADYAAAIEKISPRRARNRFDGYIDLDEIARVHKKWSSKGEASIRFGAEKRGHGYSGERGDFCLVGGVLKKSELSLFYRSLEMIGGFAYDLTLIRCLEALFYDKPGFSTITIFTMKAFVFALKGNSNEKLFPKLQEIFLE